jgi:hypothetical protein
MKILIFLLLFIFLTKQEPLQGARIMVRKSVLLDGIKRSIPSLIRRLQNTKLHDINSHIDIPILGLIDYTLKSIVLEKINIHDIEFNTFEPSDMIGNL